MIGSLKDQFLKAGLTTQEIQQFDVFTIPDDLIAFPEQRLNQKRQKHEKRFVIVLQNDKDNKDPIIRIVLVAPLSTKKEHHRLDYPLYKKNHLFLPQESYIRIRHIQPILKIDLKTKWGNISQEEIRSAIKDVLFALYDLYIAPQT